MRGKRPISAQSGPILEPLEARLLLDGGPANGPLGDLQSASISGWTFCDLDEDGIQDAGEGALADAAVELFDTGPDGQVGGGDDASMGVCITGADGEYAFAGLSPGGYYVQFRAPLGLAFSPRDAGGDDALDSDAGADGATAVMTVGAGDDLANVDAGLVGAPPDFGWAFALGASGHVVGNAVAVDDVGNRYVTGYFEGGVDLDPTEGVSMVGSVGDADVFVAKQAADGSPLWVRTVGVESEGRAYGHGIAVDAVGNVYTVGQFSGTADFDPGSGTRTLTSAGSFDVFVWKLDAAGEFVWARAIAGTGYDTPRGVVVDGEGNVYTAGTFRETADFDPGGGTCELTSVGRDDVFFWKLDAAGELVWARAVGGTGDECANAIAVDDVGNVHAAGQFEGTADFDPGAGTYSLTSAGGEDAFVLKLDTAGGFVWAGAAGGPSDDSASGIAVDGAGNVLAAGWFEGTADFDPGAGTYSLTSAGGLDVSVWTLDTGGELVWARAMGGTESEYASAIAVDEAGNVHTAGGFRGTADFDPGAGACSLTSAGSVDVFVSKLDTAGGFVWAGAMGGTEPDDAYGIAVDGQGRVHTTGQYQGVADFDPGGGTAELVGYDRSAFFSTLDGAGGFVAAGSFVGSGGSDEAAATATDADGNVYVGAVLRGCEDLDPGPGTLGVRTAGWDAVVAKYTPAGAVVWARVLRAASLDDWIWPWDLAVDAAGQVYAVGAFSAAEGFEPGPGAIGEVGTGDVFVVKLTAEGEVAWGVQMHSTGRNQGTGIAVDSSGSVYTTGYFEGTGDFHPGEETFELTAAGPKDVFVWKLDAAGELVWARAAGAGGSDTGSAIALDEQGNVHTTGRFGSTVDFDPGAGTYSLTSAGDYDAFVWKLDAAGEFVWARAMGGPERDAGSAIAVDEQGNVHTAGRFQDTADFDPGAGTHDLTSAGGWDVFVSKLDAAGGFVWAGAMGDGLDDWPSGLAVDDAGSVYTCGGFTGRGDFDPGGGTFSLPDAPALGASGFVSKLSADGEFLWAGAVSGDIWTKGPDVAVRPDGGIATAGRLVGLVDFDPSPGVFDMEGSGGFAGGYLWLLRQGGLAGGVWDDADADGDRDAGETGLDGVTVRLYLDDGDGEPEIGAADGYVGPAVTAGGGVFGFDSLPPGRYWMDLDEATVPMADFILTTDDPQEVVVAGDGDVTGVGFGCTTAGVVMDRRIFYNRSAWDGNNPSANASDDGAIAPAASEASEPHLGKTALLPGGVASFENYTSYSRGINGIMIDVANLADAGNVNETDFIFRVGNDDDPDNWPLAPAPVEIAVREGAGVGGADRITIIWADNAIERCWLQVTVKATAGTGLGRPDVFYWGNAIGETGNDAGNTYVNAADRLATRANPHNFVFNPAEIDDAYDFNRDTSVGTSDRLTARANGTNFFTALRLIAPAPPAPASATQTLVSSKLAYSPLASAPVPSSPLAASQDPSPSPTSSPLPSTSLAWPVRTLPPLRSASPASASPASAPPASAPLAASQSPSSQSPSSPSPDLADALSLARLLPALQPLADPPKTGINGL